MELYFLAGSAALYALIRAWARSVEIRMDEAEAMWAEEKRLADEAAIAPPQLLRLDVQRLMQDEETAAGYRVFCAREFTRLRAWYGITPGGGCEQERLDRRLEELRNGSC